MKTVKIKDYYGDTHYVSVSDEVYEALYDIHREEERLRQRNSYHRSRLTLDDYENGGRTGEGDPITEELIRREETERLYKAIAQLTPIQRRRVLMMLEDMNCCQIARAEGRAPAVIYRSIEKSFKHLRRLLNG